MIVKVCIYGAGAVGGFIGACLARSGCKVSVIDVGPTLEALRSNGLRLQSQDELVTVPVTATDDPAELGVQDLVVIAVKSPALVHVARRISPLIGQDTIVLTAMN